MRGQLLSGSAKETQTIGATLGQMLQPGDLIAFSGDLGAGKTCCIQGMAAGLGVADIQQVTSPTFTFIHEYQGRFPIYHFDVYRLAQEEDIYELGYEEYFYGEGVTLIEWADRIPHFLPDEYLAIHLRIQSDLSRWLEFRAYGLHYEQLAQDALSSPLV